MIETIFESPFVMVGLGIALYGLVVIAVDIYKESNREWGENKWIIYKKMLCTMKKKLRILENNLRKNNAIKKMGYTRDNIWNGV